MRTATLLASLALVHCGPMSVPDDASIADTRVDVAAADRVAPLDAPIDDAMDSAAIIDAVTPTDVSMPTDNGPADAGATDSGTRCTSSDIWTCTADHSARTRCVGGILETDPCPHDGCTPRATGMNDVCSTSCTGSASGTTMIWTCNATRRGRERCVSGVTQTDACAAGCVTQPSGTNDFCAPEQNLPGVANCDMMQWWNRPYSWSPGNYAISWGGYTRDNDLAVSGDTPVQLRHASRLVEQSVHPYGWVPQFVDTVTGEHFAFLHMRPQFKFTTTAGRTYPAGTLVGYSGGDTTDTGYQVSNGNGGVYSTGAHLCVVTASGTFHGAFPTGTDRCN